MTGNEIRFAEQVENARHNVVVEGETFRHNYAGEAETQRHNIRTENETMRSNMVKERETMRHNIESEAIGWNEASSKRISALASQLSANAAWQNAMTNAATGEANIALTHEKTKSEESNRNLHRIDVYSQVGYRAKQNEYEGERIKIERSKTTQGWFKTFGDLGKVGLEVWKAIR